ncbi:hypothetical protein BUALT_Bualt02G0155300 [Buddleja alternifolia]|uniref:Protein kinase domain-containing protein n=1 Tax=Buddleja alternifolia TaxID=168488 RepID=A0AAV6Y779_9LAMI|nr:hypothetical protein BUALT_Bualt02G0155300 [Buddleja alternifolia]
MSKVYDNWERLVASALRREQLWQLFHEQSRSPSLHSSDLDSSFNLSSALYDVAESPKSLTKLDSFPFDLEDVLKVSGELLGKGTYGSTYKAEMDNGITIVVKRLNSASISESEFKRHMEIVGRVRHENVVALLAYYSSKDEKLMLYDHYGCSVSALLHGGSGENRAYVNWETRLMIAIGAARGISQIHRQNGGTLVHGDIKSSNIFLNSYQYGCVSNLGLASMIERSIKASSYHAPEVKNTLNLSQASDVYSFGVLLLELLTCKSLTSFKSVKRPRLIAEVFDVSLLNNPTIKKQMIKMFEIGLSCLAKSPKKRPKMFKVEEVMEYIGGISLVQKLVLFNYGYRVFDLENLLDAFAERLGIGMTGISYKLRLQNGTRIVVKRVTGVDVYDKDIRQHIKTIGRTRHENVAELKACYCYSSDEILLVYNYYNQDNVSTMLHGERSYAQDRAPLNWEARVKIAMGAARGIAHIHSRDNFKLVHGNIKASNIFLNKRQFGLVADLGLAKFKNSMNLSEYCAPEVTDTREASQASDVFSFGVFLLELVSRKSPEWILKDSKIMSPRELVDTELLQYQNMDAMVRLLRIAKNCVAIVPAERPKMAEVVNVLEDISGIARKSD